MAKNGGKVKIDLALVAQKLEIYNTLFLSNLKEIKDEVIGLRNDFKSMEEGRLTTLEVKHETLKAEFRPVKKVVYLLIGTILLGVVGALIKLVILK